MAITKAKRSLFLSKAARRNHPRASKATRQGYKRRNKPSPGEFALHQRTLPGRRFVDFPLVKGKALERVQLFTTENFGSLTLDSQDQTSLNLRIEPGFIINAEFQRLEKGDLHTLLHGHRSPAKPETVVTECCFRGGGRRTISRND